MIGYNALMMLKSSFEMGLTETHAFYGRIPRLRRGRPFIAMHTYSPPLPINGSLRDNP